MPTLMQYAYIADEAYRPFDGRQPVLRDVIGNHGVHCGRVVRLDFRGHGMDDVIRALGRLPQRDADPLG